MHVHGRRDRNVGDRYVVSRKPFGLGQPCVQDTGEPMPVGCFLIDDRLVRFGIQKWFDNIFDEINVATGKPS